MGKLPRVILCVVAVLAMTAAVAGAGTPPPADLNGYYRMDNGLDLRVLPGAAAGQVAVLALVRTGYAGESPDNSGYSHLLEHIVFSGTDERSREDISREIKKIGGYLNGFTRDEFTGYILVVHRDNLSEGLQILEDMLFDSTIAEAAVEEAREVVQEEIRRSAARPGVVVGKWWARLLYDGSGFARDGLGNGLTVRSVSRRRIQEYYRSTYTPDNMLLLVAGDIGAAAVKDLVASGFGSRQPSGQTRSILPARPIKGRRAYFLDTDVPGTVLRVGYTGPEPSGQDTEAMELLGPVLSGEDGIISRALRSAGIKPLAAGAALIVNSGFSRFTITVSLPGEAEPESALAVVLKTMSSLPDAGVPVPLLESSREAAVADEILGREKLHYFLFGKASWVLAGAPGQGLSPGRWDRLSTGDLTAAARRYLADQPYVALISQHRQDLEEPDAPEAASPSARATLDNGLTVMAEQRPGSEVFALHLMTRQRSVLEPAGKEGISDFVQRLVPLAADGMDRETISSTLRRLGASLETAGNPMSPFGDFYTSASYSYIRLTSVQDRAAEAVALLGRLLESPEPGEEEVDEVRRKLLDIQSYLAQRPGEVAAGALAEKLYGDALPGHVYGTPDSVASITLQDIQQYGREYFAGRNLVITVVSGMPAGQAVQMVERSFASLPAGTDIPSPGIPLTTASASVTEDLGRGQAYLAAGSVTAPIEPGDANLLPAVSGLLNQALYEQLREKEGLAYALGASLRPADGKAVFTLSMGTSPDKLETARRRVREVIRSARRMPVSQEDLMIVINDRLGTLERRMMSSINRAFYLGLALRGGLDHFYGEGYRKKLLSVTPAQVQRAAGKYLPDDKLIEVLVR